MIETELAGAGLTGRGGAGFDTATKVRLARENRARLIVNACDGELGAAKDAWIVAHRLGDLRRGAELIADRRRTVYAAHRGSPTSSLLAAAGLSVLEVPHRYVSSEESALISLLHGGVAKPMTKKTPFVHGGRDSRGRRIRPTVVLNAETVWRVAQIADHGADWFRSVGIPEAPGPRLVSVTGHVGRPGVVETTAGTPLIDILDAAAGMGPGAEYVIVGGLAGVVLTAEEAATAVWSPSGMAAFGGGLGSGVVTVLDPTRCPVDVVGDHLAYAAGESAGQCGPCMFGLPAVADAWRRFVADPDQASFAGLETHLGLVAGRGACRHPDGVARFARSALRAMDDHLRSHVGGACAERSSDVVLATR